MTMYATFGNLLQLVMSHFLDFDVTELDMLLGIDNYKLWAAIHLYLSNADIPGVSEFTEHGTECD